MKNEKEALRRLGYDEGDYLETYDDANDTLVYPGYVCVGNPTIGVGILLDASGLQTLTRHGCDAQAVLTGRAKITQAQCNAMTKELIPRYVGYARSVLPQGMFDTLTEARQYALLSMSWNLGATGLSRFAPTFALLRAAQTAKNHGDKTAHELFCLCADHLLTNTRWIHQVGWRALRIAAMLRSGVYCNPSGNGSDIV